MAEFNPPRKWTLGRHLSYTTSELTVADIDALKGVGVKVIRETDRTETDPNTAPREISARRAGSRGAKNLPNQYPLLRKEKKVSNPQKNLEERK